MEGAIILQHPHTPGDPRTCDLPSCDKSAEWFCMWRTEPPPPRPQSIAWIRLCTKHTKLWARLHRFQIPPLLLSKMDAKKPHQNQTGDSQNG